MQLSSANANLQDYYARRASEYELIYAKPERQDDLVGLRETLPSRIAKSTRFFCQETGLARFRLEEASIRR